MVRINKFYSINYKSLLLLLQITFAQQVFYIINVTKYIISIVHDQSAYNLKLINYIQL